MRKATKQIISADCPTFILFQLVSREQQPAAAGELRAEASLGGPHAAGGGREAGGRGPVQVHRQERDGRAQRHPPPPGRAAPSSG